jgi:hypothetical protein
MPQKLSYLTVELELKNLNIKRLEDFTNSKSVISFLCLTCEYVWKTQLAHILYDKSRCPNCSGKAPLSNEIVDKILVNRNLVRLNDYINNKTPINFLCTKCNYIWPAITHNVISKQSGCPKCAGILTLTNEIIDQKLIGRQIRRLDNYINAHTKIRFQCLIDNCCHIWSTTTNSILDQLSGCPHCCVGKNEKIVYQQLLSNGIIVEKQKKIAEIIPNEKHKLRVDFWYKGTIIEYNGRQHYEPVDFGVIDANQANINFVKQQERDQYLQRICDENHIKLIWIDGREYTGKKLELYVTDKIIPLLYT